MDTLELPIVATTPSASSADGRRTRGPVDRPPLVARVFVGLIGVGASLCTVALLLSDRAPGALRSVFGDRARDLWARVDATERVDLPSTGALPPTDTLVHVAIWAVVAALLALAVWSWRALVVGGVVLVVVSGVLELAQGRYSSTRKVELRDFVANLVGIGAGLAVAALCYLAWTGLARLVRRLRRA